MADKYKTDGIDEILKRFKVCEDYYNEEYDRNKDDRSFLLGDQWDENIRNQRQSQSRPCLTENRLLPFAHQVVNDIRKARPSIIVHPVDDGADVETAEVLQGLIRNIEQNNDAESVYDTAAFNAVAAGRGYVRVGTKYSDYTSFRQEITIDRIMDSFSVYFDPSSDKKDYSDAEYCFVYEDIDKSDFEDQYPDAMVQGFDEGTTKEWASEDKIRIAEYFYKEYDKKTLVEFEVFVGGQSITSTAYKEDMDDDVISSDDVNVLREREVDVCKIKHYKLSGLEILEENIFLGDYIPIVPVLGFEAWYNDRKQVFTLIHQAKDPQRMFNYWKTASTEIIALQPKTPWMAAEGQIAGYEEMYQNANVQNYSVLTYKPMTKDGVLVPPPQRQAPPTNSGSMMQEAMSAADGITSSLGMYSATMGEDTKDISGKAIISRQMHGDNATYHFVDNLSTALKQVGKIVIGLIPLIYNDRQIIRILGEDGEPSMVPMNKPVRKHDGGYEVAEYSPQTSQISLDAGEYDVVVEIGTSYATKRQELANMIIEIARANPEIWSVAGDLFLKNLDIPGANEIAKRIRAQMPPEILGDDIEAQRLQQMQEGMAMLQQKLEETELALQVKQDNEKFNNELELMKVQNDQKETEIKALKTMAEVKKLEAETNVAIPAEAASDAALAVERLQGQLDDVSGAVDVILSMEENKKATVTPESS